MNESLKQRFSIAVSFGEITPKEYISILEKYKYYIHDIYFSPTENLKFQTRRGVYDFKSTSNKERRGMLREVIGYAHSNNIECCLTLNAPMASASEQADLFELYQSFIQIDHLTTTLNIAKLIKQRGFLVPLTCSYNEAITNKEHLMTILNERLFDAIVIGGRFLRDLDTFDLVKKTGVKTILMLNTGCCINCASYCKSMNPNYCPDLFRMNKERFGVEYMYALQSVFPEEILEYYLPSDSVDFFKLASRPIKHKELDDLLSSYSSFDSKTFIQDSKDHYHLYGRLSHFAPYYNQFDYKSIIEMKKDIWATNNNNTSSTCAF